MNTPIKNWEAGLFVIVLLACLAVMVALNQATAQGIQDQDFLSLGLDLKGGVDLTYKAEPPPGTDAVTPEMIEGTLEILRKRIDPEGVREIVLQAVDVDRIVIQVPGESSPETIKNRIGKTALLRFLDTSDMPNLPKDTLVMVEGEVPTDDTPEEAAPVEEVTPPAADPVDEAAPATEDTTAEGAVDESTEPAVDATDEAAAPAEPVAEPAPAPEPEPVQETDLLDTSNEEDEEAIILSPNRIITEGSQLKQASATVDPESGSWQVNIQFDKEGGKAFGDFTTRHIGQPFSIVLDNRVISSPNIQSAIIGGNGRITGNFTQEESRDLAILLNSGALPVTLNLLASQTVGPTLGEQAITTSVESFIFGIAVVAVFMIVIYGLLGIMADLALIMYSLLFVGLMAAFEATLTLPGIAGFILSIGMAVDANILIFERMKEELNSGKAFHHALHLAFERAFPAILDGHLTSIITGVLLYSLGTGTIKGFAVTLIMGNILSMFTAIFITRIWISIALGGKATHNPKLLGPGVKVVNG